MLWNCEYPTLNITPNVMLNMKCHVGYQYNTVTIIIPGGIQQLSNTHTCNDVGL